VKCIEHGFLMDEATAKLIADKGIWLSLQPLPDEMRTIFPEGSVQREKAEEVMPGIARSYGYAKKYKIKTAWGTDVLFSRALAQKQGAILASLVRWYTPAEALIMATSTNAQLLALSGKRNPYRGKLGVVEVGALADLLLVDGDPLQDINLVAAAGHQSRRRSGQEFPGHHEGWEDLQEHADEMIHSFSSGPPHPTPRSRRARRGTIRAAPRPT
jgi:imidazolonepropionase-like amidohydrolase